MILMLGRNSLINAHLRQTGARGAQKRKIGDIAGPEPQRLETECRRGNRPGATASDARATDTRGVRRRRRKHGSSRIVTWFRPLRSARGGNDAGSSTLPRADARATLKVSLSWPVTRLLTAAGYAVDLIR